jgi:hypothetical protein
MRKGNLPLATTALCICMLIGVRFASAAGPAAQASGGEAFSPAFPRTWDEAAIAALEVPLADPQGSPKHVSADYYYKIPVRPIYKSYTVFAPGHEPPGSGVAAGDHLGRSRS